MKSAIAALAGLYLTAAFVAGCCAETPPEAAPLAPEGRIALPNVAGRIDHLAIDPKGQRLFVAELGNGSVEAIDLRSGRSLGRIAGLKEPQGVGYLPGRDELAIATGGDGMVTFYRASDLKPLGGLKLGDDADNVRVDAQSGLVAVGYGSGALAVIDPKTREVVRKLPLPAHPESFELDSGRTFVNVPDAGGTIVLDSTTGQQLATWPNRGLHFNFPMAIDPASNMVAVVYRLPAKLRLFEAGSGAVRQVLDTCGDADDVWFDSRRQRVYVICGGGSVDVFAARNGAYAHLDRIATRGGARTGLFSPLLDRLYVASRAGGDQPAAIWVFRPH
jgi:DNA-binding beta-propeller fold protein YncE